MLYLSGIVRPDLPAMLSLRMGNRPPDGQPWAADNGRYANPSYYTDEKYLGWLRRHWHALDRCLFATAPDVVGDAAATLELSLPMLARIHEVGYPAALVAQDGLTEPMIPWTLFETLFIGGSTEWKLSPGAHALIVAAKRRGKWVHMGRVNSLRRYRAAAAMGCDSADGTVLARGPSWQRIRVQSWLDDFEANPTIWRTTK